MNDPEGNYAQSLYYSFMSNPQAAEASPFSDPNFNARMRAAFKSRGSNDMWNTDGGGITGAWLSNDNDGSGGSGGGSCGDGCTVVYDANGGGLVDNVVDARTYIKGIKGGDDGTMYHDYTTVGSAFLYGSNGIPQVGYNMVGHHDPIQTNQGGQQSTGEHAPNSAYTMRDNSVTHETLLNEFLNGTGPTYSGFGPDHPLTIKMKNSLIVNEARLMFLKGGGKALTYYDAQFGLFGIPLSAYNGAAQFVGGGRVSIIPTSSGLLYIINNKTDRRSAGYHLMTSVPRASNGITPGGTIYQRFMWVEPY